MFLPQLQNGTVEVAVKVVRKKQIKNKANIQREIQILKQLRGSSKYVVKLEHAQVREI